MGTMKKTYTMQSKEVSQMKHDNSLSIVAATSVTLILDYI
jgi:hypothetical protein